MRSVVVALLVALLSMLSASTAAAAGRTALVPMHNTPFPYYGRIPGSNQPFLDVTSGARRGHTSARGGVYWEDATYSDHRVLISVPPRFDPTRPALIVVYLHGNGATLERDVRDRQQVPEQLARSGLNAVLVAPQFAVDALDSSAGRFWEPGVFARFLDEAADEIARMQRDPRLRRVLRGAKVVIVSYSGAYQATAFALDVGGVEKRVLGVLMLDSLYGQEPRFADWITAHRKDSFFFSIYTEPARSANETLQGLLNARSVPFSFVFPLRLNKGSVSFRPLAPDVVHWDLVTGTWVDRPLTDLFRRIPGYQTPRPTRKP
jgi:hypothetical protein